MATRRRTGEATAPEPEERRDDWVYANMVPWGKNPADYGIVARVVEITPALAAQWLKFNTRNRNLKPEKIRQYTEDILDGKWELNGEPFLFSWIPAQESWQLDDGQNRLKAIIEADTSIVSLVVFGPSVDATMRTTGSGASRTAAEVLQIFGEDDANVLSGAIKHLWSYERNLLGSVGRNKFPTHSQVGDLLDKNPGIRDSVAAIRGVAKVTGIYPSVAAFLHYQFTQVSDVDATYFMDHLRTGTDARTHEQRKHMDEDAHPIRVLREWLIREKYRGSKKSDQISRGFITKTQMGTIIKAWNLFMLGEPVKSMGRIVYKPASGSRAAEKWPRIYNPLLDEDPGDDTITVE